MKRTNHSWLTYSYIDLPEVKLGNMRHIYSGRLAASDHQTPSLFLPHNLAISPTATEKRIFFQPFVQPASEDTGTGPCGTSS
jgi:hypothetical protein